ncbi:g4930 [Coccomyxa elongata]
MTSDPAICGSIHKANLEENFEMNEKEYSPDLLLTRETAGGVLAQMEASVKPPGRAGRRPLHLAARLLVLRRTLTSSLGLSPSPFANPEAALRDVERLTSQLNPPSVSRVNESPARSRPIQRFDKGAAEQQKAWMSNTNEVEEGITPLSAIAGAPIAVPLACLGAVIEEPSSGSDF